MNAPQLPLDQILSALGAMPQEQVEQLSKNVQSVVGNKKFIPSPGPQTDAYFSKADVLLFGGEPGGGKTALLLGLAFNEHQKSLIMRRQYTHLNTIADEMVKLHGSQKGFNGSPPPSLTISKQQKIELGAANRVGDELDWMGRPHDLIGIDEATHFAKSQVRRLMGWVRSSTPGQRKRVVLATNPPLSPEGLWVVEMFAPWLDPTFPNPAKPGDLRWVVTDNDDKDIWVDGPDPVMIDGQERIPTSRTYIPSSLSDNPFYNRHEYQKMLDALPAADRAVLLGGFKTSFKDVDFQCIPTAWVKLAQERWTKNPPEHVPMCSIGVDASGGGSDPLILAPRHDGWYAPLVEEPGKNIPMDRIGGHCAGFIVAHRRDQATIVLDMGGGYGGPIYEKLTENKIPCVPYKGAEKSNDRTKDRKSQFTNRRTQAYWQFREALDPDQPGGSPIMLPPDPVLVADLTAPTYETTPNGFKLQPKEDVCKRLGRSTDRGDAVVMAWQDGIKNMNIKGGIRSSMGRTPQVVMRKR